MQELIDLISTVGFPIGMCLLVYFDLRKQLEKLFQLLEARL